jgi:hypothetical protein
MADGLGEDRSEKVQKILCGVVKIFEPLARRGWLKWGAQFLFSKLQEVVEAEVRVEAEEKRRQADEAERRRVADEKAKRLQERQEALRIVRTTLAGEFRAKTISKGIFRVRNAELALEWRELDEEERGEAEAKETEKEPEEKEVEGNDEEDERVDGLPVVYTRKWKARVVEDIEGEDEVEELEETVGGEQKRARREETGLLIFNGPVSFFSSQFHTY